MPERARTWKAAGVCSAADLDQFSTASQGREADRPGAAAHEREDEDADEEVAPGQPAPPPLPPGEPLPAPAGGLVDRLTRDAGVGRLGGDGAAG